MPQVGSDRHWLNDSTVQRLQMGLFWFGGLAMVLAVVHLLATKALTIWGLVLGEAPQGRMHHPRAGRIAAAGSALLVWSG